MTVLDHPRRGPAEFTLVIYCDAGHPECEVDVLGYWPNKDGALGFLTWLSAHGSLQTPFGELMAAEARSGRPVDLGGWSGTPRGMDYGTRWRFECEHPGCEMVPNPLPARGQKMDAILEMLRVHGVPRLSMAALSARL